MRLRVDAGSDRGLYSPHNSFTVGTSQSQKGSYCKSTARSSSIVEIEGDTKMRWDEDVRFMVSRVLSVMICERWWESFSLQCYALPAWSWATIFQTSNHSTVRNRASIFHYSHLNILSGRKAYKFCIAACTKWLRRIKSIFRNGNSEVG